MRRTSRPVAASSRRTPPSPKATATSLPSGDSPAGALGRFDDSRQAYLLGGENAFSPRRQAFLQERQGLREGVRQATDRPVGRRRVLLRQVGPPLLDLAGRRLRGRNPPVGALEVP